MVSCCFPFIQRRKKIQPIDSISIRNENNSSSVKSISLKTKAKQKWFLRLGYENKNNLGPKNYSEPGPLNIACMEEEIENTTTRKISLPKSKLNSQYEYDNSVFFPKKLIKSFSVNFLGGRDSDEGLYRDNMVRVYIVTWNMAGKVTFLGSINFSSYMIVNRNQKCVH